MENAWFPIYVTDYGIVILYNNLNPENAHYSILVVPFLITTFVKLEQPSKISSPIIFKFADNTIDVKL